jgi:hypothetical protein
MEMLNVPLQGTYCIFSLKYPYSIFFLNKYFFPSKNVEIPILQASARVSSRLNYLCPQIFPASGFWPGESVDAITSENKITDLDSSCKVISAENLLKVCHDTI